MTASCQDQLQAMRALQEGWDGYGASAPQASVIDLALELVGLLEALLRQSPRHPTGLLVHPTRVGGVLIGWEDPEMEHEIDIHPDRSIGFLHQDKATGQIETRKFCSGTQTVASP